MKKTKIIIPAMGMLLLGTAASVTGTVAWFSANNKTTVTGMTVNTKVSNNLLIASDTLESQTRCTEDTFVNSLSQTRSGYLEPASTVDGVNFYYTSTSNVNASGDAVEETYVKYVEDDDPSGSGDALTNAHKEKIDKAFNDEYGFAGSKEVDGSCFGYIDYTFQIKAVNASGANDIRLTKLDLSYAGSKDASKAYRVAVFVEDITSGNPAGGVGTLKKIYTEPNAINFSAGNAVNGLGSLGTVSTVNNVIAEIAASPASTNYFKVVVRLWLEGEDKTCNNATFMDLTSAWSLDLELKMVAHSSAAAGEVAVSNITKYRNASLTIKGAASTAVVYDGTNVYKKADMSLINTKDTATIPTANLTDSTELDALNAAFGTSFAFAA